MKGLIMPRGRKKKLPVDELIVQTEKEIADLKSQISDVNGKVIMYKKVKLIMYKY